MNKQINVVTGAACSLLHLHLRWDSEGDRSHMRSL